MQGKLTSDSCSGDLATLSLNVTQISSFSFFPLLLLFIMFAFFFKTEQRTLRVKRAVKQRGRRRKREGTGGEVGGGEGSRWCWSSFGALCGE